RARAPTPRQAHARTRRFPHRARRAGAARSGRPPRSRAVAVRAGPRTGRSDARAPPGGALRGPALMRSYPPESSAMRRIVLPGEPLVDGATALRPWRDTDAEALATAARDPDIARWTRVPEHYGQEDARAFLLHRYDAIAAGEAAPFAIVPAAD